MKIYSYVVEHDNGHAPNPFFDFCTLCRCKYRSSPGGRRNIVELAEEGDWVIGTGGSSKRSAGHGKLIYAMLVSEKVPRAEYLRDIRFARKKPVENGTYEQSRGDNEPPENEFEMEEQFALISEHFYYFGGSAISIPTKFKHFEKKGPGFRKDLGEEEIDQFLEWAERLHARETGRAMLSGAHAGIKEMQIVLLRVGIDTGSGGILGPIFENGTFEYIPIPDQFGGAGVDTRTYGNSFGRGGKSLADYFPESRRERVFNLPLHFDPEFATFTYGDPTPPKASLRRLCEGDLLVFYAGLRGWDFACAPALYIIGYFEVACAGFAGSFDASELERLFGKNFHVMHKEVFEDQKNRLVLVKGNAGSKFLKTAFKISSLGTDRRGYPLHRLAPEMQVIFGDFAGNTSIQRSPPRWVSQEYVEEAGRFVRSLR